MEEAKAETTYVEEAQRQLAALANEDDHTIGKWESFKRYPWACAWCVYAVWVVLLVSFENQASGNILSIPEFRKDFGSLYQGSYVLPASWQSAFSGAPIASYVALNRNL